MAGMQSAESIVQRIRLPPMSSDSPEPLRRRARTPVAASPSPWRSRAFQYGLAFVTVILIVDALVGEKGFLDTLRAQRQYRQVAAALARKRQENTRLREEIRLLRDDPKRIEAVAREDLGLMRDGEVLFIVHDEKPPAK
jgi:cell division protein FtsB